MYGSKMKGSKKMKDMMDDVMSHPKLKKTMAKAKKRVMAKKAKKK